MVRRSLSSAGFPAVLEPAGLDRGDGRRPDGLTVFPFREGKCLTWDVTCVDTFADTVVVQSALGPGAAARQAEERKRQRYADLSQRYIFEPVALETSGVYGPAAAAFVQDLGRRISARTGERRETAWLRQRLSIAIVRGNAASVLATAPQQRRSQPRRWSPGCESESPSPRRMSGPPRCGDGTPQPSARSPRGSPRLRTVPTALAEGTSSSTCPSTSSTSSNCPSTASKCSHSRHQGSPARTLRRSSRTDGGGAATYPDHPNGLHRPT